MQNISVEKGEGQEVFLPVAGLLKALSSFKQMHTFWAMSALPMCNRVKAFFLCHTFTVLYRPLLSSFSPSSISIISGSCLVILQA